MWEGGRGGNPKAKYVSAFRFSEGYSPSIGQQLRKTEEYDMGILSDKSSL